MNLLTSDHLPLLAAPASHLLLRAAINKIANKDRLPFWMPENLFDFSVVELA
jgi:hypothetical protein